LLDSLLQETKTLGSWNLRLSPLDTSEEVKDRIQCKNGRRRG